MGIFEGASAEQGRGTLAAPVRRCAVGDEGVLERSVARAVAHAQTGDGDALRFLYSTYVGDVRAYVGHIVRDEHDAEDVTQLVFAKLMTVIVKYDERAVPFLGWLLRVARNAAIDQLRSNEATPVPMHAAETCTDEDDNDRRDTLAAALATLPQEQRNVVVLRHVIGLRPGEIAELLGRTESSVHCLHHRGRQALRQELVRLHHGPSTLRATA